MISFIWGYIEAMFSVGRVQLVQGILVLLEHVLSSVYSLPWSVLYDFFQLEVHLRILVFDV